MVNRRLRSSLDAAAKRARETRDTAGDVIQDTAKRVTDVTESSITQVQNTAQDILSSTSAIANQLRQLPADALDKIFTECPVPMFIVPVSPDSEEYVILFNFEEVFDNLKSGVFVRPKIESWAAKDDGWDVEHLCEEIRKEFTGQFDSTRERMVKSGQVDTKKLDTQIQSQTRQMDGKLSDAGRSLVKAPIEATLGGVLLNPFTGIFTWPIGLLYLGLALYNGHKAITLPLEYIELRSKRTQSQRERRRIQERLTEMEAEFDSKNEAFQQAVSSIGIKVHPQLQELYRLICEKEKTAPQPSQSGPASPNAPDVRPILDERHFRNRLPRRYRDLTRSL